MHGMINRALQGFLVATHGEETWAEVRNLADLRFDEFESMLHYDDEVTVMCFNAATQLLHQQSDALLEDLGTFLVTYKPLDPVRRLLRFGGASFAEFVMSLEELEDRGRLAIPDLELPQITIEHEDATTYQVRAQWKLPGIGPILLGLLRAMADDYGALVVLTLGPAGDDLETIQVKVLDTQHAEGRSFVLAEAIA